MTQEEFATQIKTKYPAYQNLDTATLVQKVVTKYPVYQSKISDYTPAQPKEIVKPTVEESLRQEDTLGSRTGAEQVAGVTKIKESVQKGAESMQKPGIGNKLLGAAQAGFGTISGAAQTAFAPVTAALTSPTARKLTEKVTSELREGNPELASGYDKIASKIQEWEEKHPEATTLTGDIVNTLLIGLGGSGGKAVAGDALKQSLTREGLSAAKKDVIGLAKQGKEIVKEKLATSATQKASKDLIKIQEKISPKATAKEAKLAEKEGRLIKGKEPTMFRSGKPDTVIPSDKVIKSSETIQKYIPNASKLKEPELYTALESKTAEISNKLKPEMQKISIKPETIEKINTDWEKLKQEQIRVADATEEANVVKLQKQFEEKLMKSESGTMDDLWETAKEYDASVPESVKKANSLSDAKLQYKKEIWLDNRAILRNAINDAENGLGGTSKQAFSDMHDMYNARENILSKAKIETKGKPSILRGFIKEHPVAATLIGGSSIAGATRLLP